MSKKRINTEALASELREGSVFFQHQDSPLAQSEQTVIEVQKNDDIVIPRYHDTTVSRHHDTVIPPVGKSIKPISRDFDSEELIGKIVKELKQVGSQPTTYRFTQEEKSRLAMVIFNLSNDYRVSENELVRIALNFLLDHLEEGASPYFRSPFLEVIKRLKKSKR